MALQQQLKDARERTTEAFATGTLERRSRVVSGLAEIAKSIAAGAADVTILAAAERLIQHAQLAIEARAAFYVIESVGPEGAAIAFRVIANMDGAQMTAGQYPTFDEAASYCGGIYRRRGASFAVDRVAPGKWATRPFRIGRNNA